MLLDKVFYRLLLVQLIALFPFLVTGQKTLEVHFNNGALWQVDSLLAKGDYYKVFRDGLTDKKTTKVFPEDIFKIEFSQDSTLWFYFPEGDEPNRFEMQSLLQGYRDADKDFIKWPWIVSGGIVGFASSYTTGSFLFNIPVSILAGFGSKLFPVSKNKENTALHDNIFYDKGYRNIKRKRRLPIVIGSSLIGGIFGTLVATQTDK